MSSDILFSEVNTAAIRFPDAVPEFRDFLCQHGLPIGGTDAVSALAQYIAAGGAFRDQLASMLNVVCLLEDNVSYLELLGLLLVAAAGEQAAEILPTLPTLEEPSRGIFNFVVAVKRSRQDAEGEALANENNGTLPEPPGSYDLSGADLDLPTGSYEHTASDLPHISATSTHLTQAPPFHTPAHEHGSVLARALAVSADEAEFGERRPFSSPPLDPASRYQEANQPPPFAPHSLSSSFPAAAKATPERRSFPAWAAWTLGACGILLGFFLGSLWHHANPAPASPSQTPATAAASTGPGATTATRHTARAPHEDSPAPVAQPSPPSPAWDDSFIAASNIPPVPLPKSRHAPSSAPGGDRSLHPAPPATATSSARPARAGIAPPGVAAVNLSAPPDAAYAEAARSVRLPSVLTGASGIMAANLISSPPPAYPAQASAQRVEGEVVIEAVVGRDGRVVEARVVSGPDLLRAAALRAVQDWRFRPYEVDGAPAEIATQARLEFRLPHP